MRANWAWKGRMLRCSMSGLVISNWASIRSWPRASIGVSPSYTYKARRRRH